jgi:hypothetical protein
MIAAVASRQNPMKSSLLLRSFALAAALATAGCVHESAHSSGGAEAAQSTTNDDVHVDIQGAGEWKKAPQMRAFYDATVATFANGTDIDVDAYEARSFAIFREFARASGVSEAGMVDHLKLIPRQVVGIVKEDPAVLQSFDAFWAALAGPD